VAAFAVKWVLDTHAVIWAAENDRRLGPKARKLLQSAEIGDAVMADISLLEISMLHAKGRIECSVPLADYLKQLSSLFPVLRLTPAIAADSMVLALPQGDPFDRVIVATANDAGLPLITRDRKISDSGVVRTIW
jgi:PIN domain nuclease of toxin-antitoxin system